MSLIQSLHAEPSRAEYDPRKSFNATRELCWVIIASIVVGLIACSHDSFWIDEAAMGLLASEPTLSAWSHRLWNISGSTLQMPLYDIYIWLWEKFAGHSEWALRAANIPMLVLAHFALWRAFPEKLRVRIAVLTASLINPLLWYYLNEARPYVMQYAASCLVISVLIRIDDKRNRDASLKSELWFLCAGMFLLCASSLLGFPWAGCGGLATLYLLSGNGFGDRLRHVLLPLSCAFGLLTLLTIYDLWTLAQGARASEVGYTNTLSLFLSACELLGFSGLGPGRLEVRELGIPPHFDYVPPLILLGLLPLTLLLGSLFTFLRPTHRRKVIAGAIYASAALFAVILVAQANFRLLGRHLMPASPLVCLALVAGVDEIWKTRERWAGPAMGLLWLISCLMLRFAPRHARDDYRDAAALAKAALSQGQAVWWAADLNGARYYGLTTNPPSDSTSAVLSTINLPPVELSSRPVPDLVIASKPDIYDYSGSLASYLSAKKFSRVKKLPAFNVWTR